MKNFCKNFYSNKISKMIFIQIKRNEKFSLKFSIWIKIFYVNKISTIFEEINSYLNKKSMSSFCLNKMFTSNKMFTVFITVGT